MYKKYKIARDRLRKELDISCILHQNRILRLFLKMHMTKRQRLTVDFSKKFSVRDSDVDAYKPGNPPITPSLSFRNKQKRQDEIDRLIKKVLEDYDPHETRLDRRLYREVTGFELGEGPPRRDLSVISYDKQLLQGNDYELSDSAFKLNQSSFSSNMRQSSNSVLLDSNN